MTFVTETEHSAALRLSGLADMGAVTLTSRERDDLSIFASQFAINEPCPADIASRARALLKAHAGAKATPEQVAAAPGLTDAQRFVRLVDARAERPTRQNAEAAGFAFVKRERGVDFFTGPDRSRLAIGPYRVNAMPAD